jgi:proline iminopeptidase
VCVLYKYIYICFSRTHSGFFREDGQLLQDANVLKDIPGIIVQGRYDLVCPAKTAHELHKAWPESELVYVQDAGHSCGEKGITSELVKATDKLRDLKW